MYKEIKLRTTEINAKKKKKTVTETYLCKDCIVCAEAEQKGLELCNNECDVIMIKDAVYREFVNKRENEEQKIYRIKLTDIFVNDNGEEKELSYYVGVFAEDLNDATKLANEYCKQGLQDMRIDAISKTRIIDII